MNGQAEKKIYINQYRCFFFVFTESDRFTTRIVNVLPPSLLSDMIDRDRISANKKIK